MKSHIFITNSTEYSVSYPTAMDCNYLQQKYDRFLFPLRVQEVNFHWQCSIFYCHLT